MRFPKGKSTTFPFDCFMGLMSCVQYQIYYIFYFANFAHIFLMLILQAHAQIYFQQICDILASYIIVSGVLGLILVVVISCIVIDTWRSVSREIEHKEAEEKSIRIGIECSTSFVRQSESTPYFRFPRLAKFIAWLRGHSDIVRGGGRIVVSSRHGEAMVQVDYSIGSPQGPQITELVATYPAGSTALLNNNGSQNSIMPSDLEFQPH